MRNTNTTTNLIAAAALATTILAATPTSLADINLELRARSTLVDVGEVIEIDLLAISDSAQPQTMAAVDALFDWDTGKLQLDPNVVNPGANPPSDPYGPMWCFSGFPANAPFGQYSGWGALGTPLAAEIGPDGTLLTTIRFTALQPATATTIDLINVNGDPSSGATAVWSSAIPGLTVTGTTLGVTIQILGTGECPPDINGDRIIDLADLQLLLAAYGSCDGDTNFNPAADMAPEGNLDGCIDLADLQLLLAYYGTTCPD